CAYKGEEFKFGETRPDAKPCETCICHHGLWKCDIKPSCFLNNLPIRSDDLSCLVSHDGKNHVLPCPIGFSCRVPHSDDLHDSFRVGACKPNNKVKKPKTDVPLLELQLGKNRIFESEEEKLLEDRLGERRMPAELEYKEILVFTEMKTTSAVRPTSAPTVHLKNDQEQNAGLMRHVCLAYPDKRSCSTQTSIRWFYNATTRSCVQFTYGGCGGNFNNFLSEEKCQEVCQSDLHPTVWQIPPTQPSPMYVSTQTLDDHGVPGKLLDMCHDMKSGMSYRNGEKWHVDACTSCSCVSGRALCVAATCPITCLNPVHVEGKCCPICKFDENEEIIVDGGDTRCKDSETELWYHSGESWDRYNCTKCVCFEGEISCMASVCSKPLCPNPIKKDGVCCPVCSEVYEQVTQPTKGENNVECKNLITGKVYLPGEGWNINDCVSCFCNNNGQQVCHETKCSVSKCKNPVHLQGRCCPVCPEVFHSACIYDDHQYFQGDFMLLRDMCTLCKCNGNMWNCTKKHCNKTAKYTFVSPYTLKPTAPYKNEQDTTADSGFYMSTKMMENIPTDDDTEKSEDYIMEDPVRMTRRYMKKVFPIIPTPDNAKEKRNSHTEKEKLIAIMLNYRPTTAPITSAGRQRHLDNEHHNIFDHDYIDWVNLQPTEKSIEQTTLPWTYNFNHKMWSNWDEPEYIDVPDEKTDSVDVYDRKWL
ncbi:Cysteine-rich motor neuron 1, partial [Paramuricea clavata]